MEFLASKIHYWIHVILMLVGLYGMMLKTNLLKKVIGMSIFQWSIILFFISVSAKRGATVPVIIFESLGSNKIPVTQSISYVNPLPHVLMLTAIVVAVATTGIALALLILINNRFGTIEEDDVIKKLADRR